MDLPASQVSSEAGPISQMRRLRSGTIALPLIPERYVAEMDQTPVWHLALSHSTTWELRRLHGKGPHTHIRTQQGERDGDYGGIRSPSPSLSIPSINSHLWEIQGRLQRLVWEGK